MTDVILRISGMDCGACAVRIVRALRGLPGLREVTVSDTAGCARLTYDETAVDLGEIARCVQRAELTAQHGGEEALQGRTRQRLARRLGLGVLLTALMLWRLPVLVQLALAAGCYWRITLCVFRWMRAG